MTRQTTSLRRAGYTLVVLFIWLWFSTSAFAQNTGSISGRVTDQGSNHYLIGAEVRLSGSGQTTSTDRTGSYELVDVPAGSHVIEVNYLDKDSKTVPVEVKAGQRTVADVALTGEIITLATFKVESIREGQSRAINQQRASNTISNIIASDAISNLPDNTIGEALARVAGVNVQEDVGEPSYVTIRGAAPQLNSIRVDGQGLPAITDPLNQAAGSDNRSSNVSLIPSEIVSSIEVVKALTPDTDADSIGGQVNIRTRSGFEVAAPIISGSIDSYNADFKNRWGQGGSFSYFGPLNAARTVGLGVNVNYRNVATDEQDTETIFYPKTDPAVSGIAGITGGDAISEFDARLRQQRRITIGASANLDLKVGSNTVLKLRTFYNNAEKYQTTWRTRSAALTSFASTSTDTLASGKSARVRKVFYDQLTNPKIYQVGASGTTTLDNGSIDYEASYNYAPVKSRLTRYDTDTTSSVRKKYQWTVDRTNPLLPVVRISNTATGVNGYTAGDDSLLDIWKQTGNDAERNYTGALDYTRVQNIGGTSVTFKFGAKYSGKMRRQRPVLDLYTPIVAPVMKTFALSDQQPGGNLLFGTVPTLGTYASLSAVLDTLSSNPANYAFTSASANTAVSTILARIYDVSEDVGAAYGMATANFGKLEAIAGLRLENTSDNYNWMGGNPHILGSTSYTNYLPDLLFNYRFTKNRILRASWTHTIARPDYNELLPYTTTSDPAPSIDTTPGTLTSIYKGNPNLRAAKSSNFDLSLEWYYQPTGLASIGLFHKDISSFIYRSTVLQTVNGTTNAIHQFQNGATATENGIELSWTQSLSRLPGPLSGLGFSANTSIILGKSSIYMLDTASSAQVLVSSDYMPYQPKSIQNFQIYWEKYGFTARVGFNYVSSYINPTDGHTPNVTVAASRRLDATLQYRLTKNLIIFIQGKNLRRQMQHWYDYGDPNLSEETDYLGPSYIGGVKYHF